MFLAEVSRFAPVVNFEPWNDGVLRQRRRIEQPGVRNNPLQLHKIFVAELTPPELLQRLEPEQRKPHLLLQVGLEGRRNMRRSISGCLQQALNVWNVTEIE